jgi:hypothetical protein
MGPIPPMRLGIIRDRRHLLQPSNRSRSCHEFKMKGQEQRGRYPSNEVCAANGRRWTVVQPSHVRCSGELLGYVLRERGTHEVKAHAPATTQHTRLVLPAGGRRYSPARRLRGWHYSQHRLGNDTDDYCSEADADTHHRSTNADACSRLHAGCADHHE